MTNKVGRNDPCSCGSGKKYKKCCEPKHKHKKFEAKVLSSSSSIAGAFFTQPQNVSSLFNRQIKSVTPLEAPAPSEASETEIKEIEDEKEKKTDEPT